MRSPITFFRQSMPIEALEAARPGLLLDPHYQRQGDVWSRPRQRLFIDSILNGFIVPPMYWHALEPSSEYFDGLNRYAVVDGRQRLEAVFAFLDGDLRLSKDNALLSNPDVSLDGMTISTLREELPWLYAALMRAAIDVVIIDTAEIDLIEELFSRLNEGVPLSAAEKRNRGAVLAPLVREFAEDHRFFTTCLPFGNTRYRHYDLLAKLMRIEDRGLAEDRVPDLRKVDLDRLFERLRADEDSDPAGSRYEIDRLLGLVRSNLDQLAVLFEERDRYLSSIGMVTLYYAIAHYLAREQLRPLSRLEVEHFEGLRQAVKDKDDEDLSDDEMEAVEFARYSQGTTSGTYLTARLRIFLSVERNIQLDH